MTRPLSNDLRERVVAAVESRRELPCCGGPFGVAVSSVVKWSSAIGDRFGGAGQDGRPPQADSGAAPGLHRGAAQPDPASDAARSEGRTGRARREGLAQHGLEFLRREGCASKKTLFALEQARADIARRRQRWQACSLGLDPQRLVFIDETWIKTNMAPLRGWGPKGKRCAALPRTATGAR